MEGRHAEVRPLPYTQSVDIDYQDHGRLYSTCKIDREDSFDLEDDAIQDECSDREIDDTTRIKIRRAGRLKETSGWVGYLKDFSIFFSIPYTHERPDCPSLYYYSRALFDRNIHVLMPLSISS